MEEMFRYFRLKMQPDETEPSPGGLSEEWLSEHPEAPITVAQLNCLPENTKRRAYRGLLPPDLLARFNINPLTWRGADGSEHVVLRAEEGTGVVSLSARTSDSPDHGFLFLELADNCFNGVCLNFLALGDPQTPG